MITNDPWAIFNDPFFIGFNHTLNRLNNVYTSNQSYPPYNVIKSDEDSYQIEIAVAGFNKKDLDISVENSTLIIKGNSSEEDNKIEFMHKGIASRKFTRAFALGEFMEVVGAEFENGMLTIHIDRIIPEEKKPKSIKIK
jgi:molecular chaperone IbpA